MSAAAQQAWGEYREAIEALYSRSTRELIEMEGVGIAGEPSDEAIETALKGSDALSDAIQSDLDSAGAEQRELAILQLSAAAVVDLSVAHDLALNAGAEEAQPEFEATEWAVEGVEAPPPGEPALTDELAVVGPILDVEPGAGIWAAISAGGAPAEPGNYRENLEKAVDAALDGICGDAAKVGTKTFHGLLTLPGVDLAQVAGSGVASVFDGIDSESDRYLLRRAARFVLKGLEKILSVFGTNTQAVFKKVVAWAEGLGEDGIRTFLERIYGMKGAGTTARVDQGFCVGREDGRGQGLSGGPRNEVRQADEHHRQAGLAGRQDPRLAVGRGPALEPARSVVGVSLGDGLRRQRRRRLRRLGRAGRRLDESRSRRGGDRGGSRCIGPAATH